MKTIKINRDNFKTNSDLCDKEVLRYCENFSSYISHIVYYFKEPLVVEEIQWCNFLIDRLSLFVKGCPPVYEKYAARYQRVITRLEHCLTLNSQKL